MKKFIRNVPDGMIYHTHGIKEDLPKPGTWDFVEQFLPKYQWNEDVTFVNDVGAYLDGAVDLEDLLNNQPELKGLSKEKMLELQQEVDQKLLNEAHENFCEMVYSGEITVINE